MNLIRPSIFSESATITAVFTQANRFSNPEEHSVNGLDFGINTSTKKGETEKNYNSLLNGLGLKPNSVALARQVHGSNIEVVEKAGIYEDTDGLITKKPGLSLGIQVADCAAVLIADEINQIIGAFHAGWRGAVSNILPKAVEKMKSVGGQVRSFKSYISPCISKQMFEVGEEVAEKFPDSFVDRSTYAKPHVDLKGFLTHQLIEAGMRIEQIEISPWCTMQDNRFFSYRREREKSGRMLGLITLNKK